MKIAFCSYKASKFFCENYHYSKSIPVPPLITFGVWEYEKMIGTVIFSRGASPSLLKPYNLEQDQGCELSRVALDKHKTPVSKILSVCINILKKKFEKLELIVSFADTDQNHYGGIYQASNWLYTGITASSYFYIDENNRKWHSRQVSEKGYNIQQGNVRKTKKPSELTKVKSKGKHRYIYPLKNKEKYLSLKKTFPKRVEHESNAVTNHVAESGAIPTDALQTSLG